MKLLHIIEDVQFQDTYQVNVSGFSDQPVLEIPNVGYIRLFYTGSTDYNTNTKNDYWAVHMIRGEQKGAATVLYFAALLWALTNKKFASTHGQLASDTSLSPDAVRARLRFQKMYADYLYIFEHPEFDSVKVHNGDNSDFRRKAEAGEACIWRLKKEPPFRFKFT